MSFTPKCLALFRFSKIFNHLFCLFFFTYNCFIQPNVFRINWPPLSWVVLKIDPHNTYIKKNGPPKIFQPLHLINNDCSLKSVAHSEESTTIWYYDFLHQLIWQPRYTSNWNQILYTDGTLHGEKICHPLISLWR
jgi:hypothetical protein